MAKTRHEQFFEDAPGLRKFQSPEQKASQERFRARKKARTPSAEEHFIAESLKSGDYDGLAKYIASRLESAEVDQVEIDKVVPQSLQGLNNPVADDPDHLFLQMGSFNDGTIDTLKAYWDGLATTTVGTAPVLFQVIAARYFIVADGSIVPVGTAAAAVDVLRPAWDWPRFHS